MADQSDKDTESFRRRLFSQYISTLMQQPQRNLNPPSAAFPSRTLTPQEALTRERLSQSLCLSSRTALARDAVPPSTSELSSQLALTRERIPTLSSSYLASPLLSMDQLRSRSMTAHPFNTQNAPGGLHSIRDPIQNSVQIANLSARHAENPFNAYSVPGDLNSIRDAVPNNVSIANSFDIVRNAAVALARQNSPVMGPCGLGDNNFKKTAGNKSEELEESSVGAHDSQNGERLLYISRIQDLDVLCGRGGKSNHHPGNKLYRQVVSEMKEKYKNIEGKSAKTDLSRAIVDHVYTYGGRFVRKDESSGHYYLVSLAEARKKTSQALRETKELKWTA